MSFKPVGAFALVLVVVVASTFWWAQHTLGRQAAPAVYVALGASDAVGVGTERPSEEGWVPRLYAKLPAGSNLLNLGISGATLGDVLTQEVPPALDAQPHWVTIWPGVNDLRDGVTLPTFTAQLDALLAHWNKQLDTSTSHPDPVVVVLNIPDLRQIPAFHNIAPALLDATVQQWNQVIATAANKHGVFLVDLYAHGPDLRAHPDYLSGDGFHPSSAGYARIADIVFNVLEQHHAASTP